MTFNSSAVPWDRGAQIRWMNQSFYPEAPFDLNEVAGVREADSEIGYCDCCDEMTMLTRCVETSSGEMFLACEDCGRKVQRVLLEMSRIDR